MFEDLIDNNLEKLKPHLQAASDKVEGYAWMVLANLERIASNTTPNEPFILRRERFSIGVSATRFELDTVPMGQEWELEVVALSAAGVLTIDNGRFVYTHDFGDAYQGRILFEAGTTIGLTCTTGVNAYLQFAAKTKPKGKRAVAGFENPETTAAGPDAPVERHVSSGVGHKPIVPSGDSSAAVSSG